MHLKEADRDRSIDPALLSAARAGWGVTIRLFLNLHGRSLLRWTAGAGITSVVTAGLTWLLQHR